jgi:predicted DCC family thiol-disulfide oxidoreductase YuxK
MPPTLVTVWFDGACPLCRREIALMRRLDRRGALRLIDVSGATTACPLDRATLLARFHAQVDDGPLLVGAAAFAAVWRALPGLRLLGIAARWRPLAWLLDRAYDAFLRHRPRLQALAARWLERA